MSRTIDQRVVSMEFDNKRFEGNVQQSLSTLDRLNKAVNAAHGQKSLQGIAAASNASAESLKGIAASVEFLQNRFSTLGIIGMQVIRNLTDMAMGFVGKIFKFIKGGIITGGINRAMNIEKARFQLQGLLKDTNKVEAVMKNVNDAVDGTAYGLDAAALVASQFAASGMQAGDKMYTSLRAVAGVAAMTNSEYSDIGRIFTTVAGNGRLMGEQLLQLSSRGINAAAALAEHLGVSEQVVRDMVSKGKIDFETFAEAMDSAFGEHAKNANKTFTGAMANIRASMSRIGALFVSPLIGEDGPLVKFLNAVMVYTNDIKKALEPFAERVTTFLNTVIKMLTKVVKGIDQTNKFKIFYNLVDAFVNIFKALWMILKPIGQALSNLIPAKTGERLVWVTEKFKLFTEKLIISEAASKKLGKALKSVVSSLSKLFSGIGSVISGVINVFASFAKGVMGRIPKFNIDPMTSAFEFLLDLLYRIGEHAAKIGAAVGGFFRSVGKIFGENFDKIIDILNALALFAIGKGINKDLSIFGDTIEHFKNLTSPMEKLKDILGAVRSVLEQYQNKLRAEMLTKIAIAIGILAAAIFVLASIKSKRLLAAVAAMGAMFAELLIAMHFFVAIAKSGPLAIKSLDVILVLSTSILILSAAMKVIGSMNLKSIGKGLAGITGLTVILLAFIKVISASEKIILKGAANMMVFGVSMRILAEACIVLAKLSWKEIGKGLTATMVLMSQMAVFSTIITRKGGSLVKGTASLIGFAAAIAILAKIMMVLGRMSKKELIKGSLAIGVLMSTMLIFSKAITYAGGSLLTGTAALIGFAAAIAILAKVMITLGKLKWKNIVRGLTALGVIMLEMAIAMRIMSKMEGSIKNTIAVIGFAAAIMVIANAMVMLAKLDWGGVGRGVASIIAVLGMFVGISAINNAMGGLMFTAAALVIFSTAIFGLAVGLKLLGSISWGKIGKGLLTLVGVFAILVAASAAIQSFILGAIVLTTLLMALGVAAIGVGAGMVLLGLGLDLVAAALVAIIKLAGQAVKAIVTFVTGIAGNLDILLPHLKDIFIGVIDLIVDLIPRIVEGILKLVLQVLNSLVKYAPQIVNAVMDFLIEIIRAIGKKLPVLVKEAIKLVYVFFASVVDSLKGLDTKTLLEGIAAVSIMSIMMISLAAAAALTPAAMVGVIGLGLVMAELMLVLAAFGKLSQISGLSTLINEGSKILSDLGRAIGDFLGNVVGGFLGGVSSNFPKIGKDLSDFMENLTPFVEGLKNIDANSTSGVKALAETILILTGAEILDGIARFIGGNVSIAQFGLQIAQLGPFLKIFAKSVEGIDAKVVSSSAAAAKSIAEFAAAIPNEGGLLAGLVGENNLVKFGFQLAMFGPLFKTYANAIAGVNSEVVTASSAAAQSIAQFAQDIPNSGGLISWLTGDNDIDTFGRNLASFGRYFLLYSAFASGIDASVVTKTSAAAQSLVQLASAMPATQGWIKANDTTLADLGRMLPALGLGLAAYSTIVKNVDTGAVQASIRAVDDLIQLFGRMSVVDQSVAVKFNMTLANIAKMGINGFIIAFRNAAPLVRASARNMIIQFTLGLASAKVQLKVAVAALLVSALSSLKNSSLYNQAFQAGRYIGEGFVRGITVNFIAAAAVGRALALKALDAAKRALNERSPSVEFWKVGNYGALGFINGLIDNFDASSKAGSGMATSALIGLKKAVRGINDIVADEITDPVIKPIIDLTDVNDKASRLNSMFDQTRTLAVSASTIQNGNLTMPTNTPKVVEGSTFTFHQNNYSPKALSELEIYRQTKNQFSSLKGLVE